MPVSTPIGKRLLFAPTLAGLRRYPLYIALALLGVGATEVALYALRVQASNWTAHSRLVARIARDALVLSIDRETAIRGYLITGDSSSLQPELKGRAELPPKLDSLRTLTKDNPSQEPRALAIAAAVNNWDQQYAQHVLQGRPTNTTRHLAGQQQFDQIRSAFGEFLVAEEVLFDARSGRDSLLTLLAQLVFLIPISALAFIFISMGRRLADQADHVLAQQHQLEEQAIELEQQVEELELANTELSEAVSETLAARDIAEEEVRERTRTHALLEAAMDCTPIPTSLLDLDLRYIRVNKAITNITGISHDQHLGLTLRELNPRVNDEMEAALRNVAITGEPLVDMKVTRPEVPGVSHRREMIINGYPIRANGGEILGVGVSAIDTTEQLKLQEQFHQAQKLEAVGRLAAGIAHDFNNLLTVIRTYCELVLLEISPTSPHRPELKEIHLAAERAGTLARQLLSVGRRNTLLPKPLDLNDVIKGVETMLRRVTRAGVKVNTVLEHSLGLTFADPSQIEQVLMNLVINAVDAMPTGGEISIRTANAELTREYTSAHSGVKVGSYVRLSVSDTGTGMSKETIDHIFEPFFTTKGIDNGTGLGLATVYGIMQQIGGHISVDSVEGRGTTFLLYFPRELSEEGTEPRRARAMQYESSPRGAETVLVAEDDDALLASLSHALTRAGYTVLNANHGGAAIRIAAEREKAIDLLLTDLHMPGMDGRDLAKRVLAIHPETKVLFMSGSSSPEGSPIDLPDKDSAFIPKPFSVDDLAKKVRAVLD